MVITHLSRNCLYLCLWVLTSALVPDVYLESHPCQQSDRKRKKNIKIKAWLGRVKSVCMFRLGGSQEIRKLKIKSMCTIPYTHTLFACDPVKQQQEKRLKLEKQLNGWKAGSYIKDPGYCAFSMAFCIFLVCIQGIPVRHYCRSRWQLKKNTHQNARQKRKLSKTCNNTRASLKQPNSPNFPAQQSFHIHISLWVEQSLLHHRSCGICPFISTTKN